MTPAALKSKLTLHLPLAASLMTALFLCALQYIFLDIDSPVPTAADAPTPDRHLFLWGSIIPFLLLLFFAIRFLLVRTTEPLFAFISHIEQLPPTTAEERLSPLPASRERAPLDSSFSDLIAQLDQQREEVARHEQLYRTVVECSTEVMFWISADQTTIHYISPHCRELTGYEPKDFYSDAALLDRIYTRISANAGRS